MSRALQRAAEGICKLTRRKGRFVRAHILPRALTDKALDKVSRVQLGADGSPPKLVHNTWYDSAIVTQSGETILSDIDAAGVRELRRLGLGWRFFPLVGSAERHPLGEFELIRIADANGGAIQRLIHSVLWRAAVSMRPEFSEIRVDVQSREKLRKIVAGETRANPSDFPAVLVLLTTAGQPQVLGPLRQKIATRAITGANLPDVKMFRFFLNGLIAHVGRKANDERLLDAWKGRVVGDQDGVIVLGRKYEGSSQEDYLNFHQYSAERLWPKQMDEIYSVLEREPPREIRG